MKRLLKRTGIRRGQLGVLLVFVLAPALACGSRPTGSTGSTTAAPAAPTATPLPLVCFPASEAFARALADDSTARGKAALANVTALPIALSGEDQAQWFLVGASIGGPGRRDETLGLWATTADPAAVAGPTGTLVSVNTPAAEFSSWPKPPDIDGRFGSSDPDVRRIEGCVKDRGK